MDFIGRSKRARAAGSTARGVEVFAYRVGMRIAIASILLASVLTSCSSKSSPTAAGSGTATGGGSAATGGGATGSGSGSAPTPGVGTAAPVAGPPRLDLTTGDAPIGATVSAPAGATATTSREELVATDGYTWA